MRILILALEPVAGWGGSEELWAATAHAALADGHEVWIAPRVDSSGDDASLRQLSARGARLVTRRSWTDDAGVLRGETVPAELLGLWPSVDVVFVSAGGSLQQLLDPVFLDLLTRIPHTPVVATIQLAREQELLPDDSRWQARNLLDRLAALILPAHRSLAVLERIVATRIERYAITPSPIRHDLRGPLGWPEFVVPAMACVARLNPIQKGQDLLLEVLSGPQWQDREWELTFVGRGLGRAHLAELASFYGLADKVRFAGFQHDMNAVWSAHHLLVLPSREESMSIAIMEAMFSARACVVTDVGDSARLITHGVNGFVAAGDRPRALSAALEDAWAARGEWREMGLRAHTTYAAQRDPTPGRTTLALLRSAAQQKLRPLDGSA